MLKISLDYRLTTVSREEPLANPLFTLLAALRETGSIGATALKVGYSYRHVWGELKRWERELGEPLVAWGKGKAASLSPFGEKLLWAEARARARVMPQVLSLQGELERVFSDAFNPDINVITVTASHDLALPTLRDRLSSKGVHLDMRYAPSLEALAALTSGRAQLAGFHVSDDHAAQSLTARTFKRHLKPGLHKLIGYAARRQGLMVAPGNPLKLAALADIAATGARFANRQAGSGTRVEFEQLLARQGVPAAHIVGYAREESTHLAVAAAIAAGEADTGFGIEAAAHQYRLGFVPLATERYYLVCLKESLDTPGMVALRTYLASASWQAWLNTQPGYAADQSGQVLALTKALPWYRYRTVKGS
jgi:putative molybdopterin biosynthesis protein